MNEEPKYYPKTDAELEQLAQDMVAGKFFHSEMLKNMRDIQFTFMPLALMDEEQRMWFINNDVVFMYEYYDKAGPRSVNGMPIFYSVQYLNLDDTKKLWARAKIIHEFLKARTDDPTKPNPA